MSSSVQMHAFFSKQQKIAEIDDSSIKFLAEARGFEPPERLPAHTLSKRAP